MPRTKSQNDEIKKERKEKILLHALRLFAGNGLAATKISDISQAADISQGLVYHYFSSKDDIFVEIIKTAFMRLNLACRLLEEMDMPADEKIKFALFHMFENLQENKDHGKYHLLIAQAMASNHTPLAAQKIMQKEYLKPYKVLSRIIAKGQKEGTIRTGNPDELALMFWTCIKGLALHQAVHAKDFKLPDPHIFLAMFDPI